VDYNFPNVKVYPKVWIRTDPEADLKPLAERDQILVRGIGLPITKKYFYETYGIPQPEAGEDLVEIPAIQPPLSSFVGTRSPVSLQNQQFVEKGQYTPEQQALEGLIEKTSVAAAQSLAANEKKIMEIIESSQNYEEARKKLQELNFDMNEFETLIERSALAGLVFGKYTMIKEEHA
jgi:phage gp29-like protein